MAGELLRINSGPLRGHTFPVDGGVVLGRSRQPPGNLGGDDELSRRHASLQRTPDGRIVVEDLGSTNGTLVNGERINRRRLRPGDQIALGQAVLAVSGQRRPR